MIDEIQLCNSWKEVVHDGMWCEKDNLQTWEQMVAIFNAEPKKPHSFLWKDRVVTPDALAQLWVKVEPKVAKYNRYYKEMIRLVPDYNKRSRNYPINYAMYIAKETTKNHEEAVQPDLATSRVGGFV